MYEALFFLACCESCNDLRRFRKFLDSKYEGRDRRVSLLILICVSYTVSTILEIVGILIFGRRTSAIPYPFIIVFFTVFTLAVETMRLARTKDFISIINFALLIGYPFLLAFIIAIGIVL